MLSSALKIQYGEEDKPKVVCEYAGLVSTAFTLRGMATAAGETTPIKGCPFLLLEEMSPKYVVRVLKRSTILILYSRAISVLQII